MKLSDLQEMFDTVDRGHYADRPYPSGRFLGAGMYSDVYDDEDDPHLVKKQQKRSKFPPDNDGFLVFADLVSRRQLWDNVHYPRIYETESANANYNKIARSWKVEKLSSFHLLDDEEVDRLANRYFTKGALSTLMRGSPAAFCHKLQGIVANNREDCIKDDEFKEAVIILIDMYKFAKKNNKEGGPLILDIHTGNVMIRRTPAGPQLVFVDPFV